VSRYRPPGSPARAGSSQKGLRLTRLLVLGVLILFLGAAVWLVVGIRLPGRHKGPMSKVTPSSPAQRSVSIPPQSSVPSGTATATVVVQMPQNAAARIQLLNTALLAAGGVWALYLYRASRRGQTNVGIAPEVKLCKSLFPDKTVVLTKLKISNTSGVLFRYQSATATLMDANGETDEGLITLIPFARQDPLRPVYGPISKDRAALASGKPFLPVQAGISLEPGEYVETEMAFVLKGDTPGLFAMRVTITGRRGIFGREPYNWATFFFIDTGALEPSDGAHTREQPAV
jgi:hypothetical protein